VNALLLRASELARAGVRGAKRNHRGADLIGAQLKGADLRGADLADSIFLSQSQLEAAKGDATTKIPAKLARPAHWPELRPMSGPGPGRDRIGAA
jgi:uncharacterized protein YjbI with pentapeptide repeats